MTAQLLYWGLLPAALFLIAVVLVWINRTRLGWQIVTYVLVTLGFAALGGALMAVSAPPPYIGFAYVLGASALGLAGIGLLLGLVEFVALPILGQFRLGAISRVTYYEALLQPFTLIILAAGLSAIVISARISFFTYNEDFKMYRDVASSFVFLFTLPVMIFASTKVIDEEIENRTMLTLMSKPVSRWQVILGKYLGVLLLIFVCVAVLGLAAAVSSYLRYFDDMLIDYRVTPLTDRWTLDWANHKAFMALLPSLVLTFLQVATLAAISVAVSTRYGLAANVTVVVIIYIAANLARFVQATTDLPQPFGMIASILTYILPGLTLLDLNQRLVFGDYILGKTDWDAMGGILPTYGEIWRYVGMACVYSVFYIGASLSLGMALFRSRELT